MTSRPRSQSRYLARNPTASQSVVSLSHPSIQWNEPENQLVSPAHSSPKLSKSASVKNFTVTTSKSTEGLRKKQSRRRVDFDKKASPRRIFLAIFETDRYLLQLSKLEKAWDEYGVVDLVLDILGSHKRVTKELESLPYEVRQRPVFELPKICVDLTGDLLADKINSLPIILHEDNTRSLVRIAKTAVKCLDFFIRLAQNLFVEWKPLPRSGRRIKDDAIPLATVISNGGASSSSEQTRSATRPLQPAKEKLEAVEEGEATGQKAGKKGIFYRVLSRDKLSSSSSVKPEALSGVMNVSDEQTVSAPPPCGPSILKSGSSSYNGCEKTTQAQMRSRTHAKYNIRDSVLVFPDPADPASDVKMPHPEGEAFHVFVNAGGVITGASLPAMIRLLTSKEGVIDNELTETFFMCFRLFSTPTDVFNAFVARYKEQPPVTLTEAQLRVWQLDTRAVRFRVAKMLLTWLRLHWRHQHDKAVFAKLLEFIFCDTAEDLPPQLRGQIIDALGECAASTEEYRGCRLEKKISFTKKALNLEEETPTTFNHPLLAIIQSRFHSYVDILSFDSSDGRQELARQLTIKASSLFRRFDPEDAVTYWRDSKNEEVGRLISELTDFENSLSYWVMHTILRKTTCDARASVIVLWFKVAMVNSKACLDFRNFSGAASIWCAVGAKIVMRFCDTEKIAREAHGDIYDRLEKVFGYSSNFCHYRAALRSSTKPAVPMLSVLIHDIAATTVTPSHLKPHPEDISPIINIAGFRIVARTIQAMEACHVPYNFKRIQYMQRWIEHSAHLYSDFEGKKQEDIISIFTCIGHDLEPIRRATDSAAPL